MLEGSKSKVKKRKSSNYISEINPCLLLFTFPINFSNFQNSAKMGLYPFLANFPAKCPMSETIEGYAPVLKLDFSKSRVLM